VATETKRRPKRSRDPEEIDRIMSLPTCTVDDAAEVLGIGRSQAYQAVNAGTLRSVRIGKRVVVPVAALRELLGRDSDVA
jgi:excisionase family DNA binding protein